jgi:hypothetical protein
MYLLASVATEVAAVAANQSRRDMSGFRIGCFSW